MSVIQEALRRKMAEQAEQGVQTPAAPQSSATNYQLANPATQQAPAQPAPVQPQPSTSPPQPVYTHPPVAQAAPAERSTSWFILLFLFLLAGGAAVMFFVQSRQMGVAVTTVAPASSGGET